MRSINFKDKIRRKTLGVALVRAAKGYLLFLLAFAALLYVWLVFAYLVPHWVPFHIPPHLLLGFGFGVPLAISLFIVISQQLNIKRMSLMIERHYPQLHDRLTTVLELSEKKMHPKANAMSVVMAEGLQYEMSDLMDRFNFGKVASPKGLVAPVILCLSLLLVGTGHAMVQPDFFRTSLNTVTTRQDAPSFMDTITRMVHRSQFEIEVTPGDCDVGRGSSLLIEARVYDHESRKVELYVKTDEDPSWQMFPMVRLEKEHYQMTLPHIMGPSTYYVKADYQESEMYLISVFDRLAVEKAVWQIYFPEYMHLPEQSRQGWRDKVTVPRGTSLSLKLYMNRPVEPGWILVEDERRYELSVTEAENVLSTEFVATKDLLLKLEIRSTDGELLVGAPAVWLQTLTDMPPYIEVLEPQLQNYVFPSEEIPFEISVNDDYDLRAVTLVLRFQGREERIEWLPEGLVTNSLELKPVLELEKLGAKSRDLIFAHVEADDGFPGEPTHVMKTELYSFLVRDYVEEFQVDPPEAKEITVRKLFEPVLVAQENLIQDIWDLISAPSGDTPTIWSDEPDKRGTV